MTTAEKDIIERFAASYFDFHQISAPRRQMQVTQLRRYETFLDGLPIEQAGGDQLQDYMEHLISDGYAPNSVALYQNMIRSFASWAYSKKLISADTLLQIREVRKPPGAKPGVPRPYSTNEMKAFWADLDKRYPYKELNPYHLAHLRKGTLRFANYRDHVMRLQLEAIVLLAVCCGLRRQEIFFLTMEDLHPDNEFLTVTGKGGEDREVPYADLARKAVVRWFEFRKMLGVAHEKPWIRGRGPRASDFNQPMSLDSLSHQMSRIGNGYELHRLRHSAATNWLREGMPLEVLQRLLGHGSIQMTLHYAKLNREDVARQMEDHESGFVKRLGLPKTDEANG